MYSPIIMMINLTSLNSTLAPRLTEVSFPILLAWLLVTSVLELIGGLAIVLLLYVMYRLRKLRTGSGILIAHYQFLLILMCFVQCPLNNISFFLVRIKIPIALHCPFVYFIYVVNYSAIAWADAALAVNRFVAILVPQHYPFISSRKVVWCKTVSCWLIALICGFPQYLSPRIKVEMLPSGACNIVRSEGKLLFFLMLIALYIPLGSIGCLYTTIFLSRYCARCRNRVMTHNGVENPVMAAKMERRIASARILFYSFLWYCICFIPLSLIPLFLAVQLNSSIPLLLCTKSIFYLAFAAEPAFFYAMSSQYRREALKVLTRALACIRNQPKVNQQDATRSGSIIRHFGDGRLDRTAYFRSGFDVSRV